MLSAADEVAVDAFLKERIKFTDIPTLIYSVLKETYGRVGRVTLHQAAEADAWAREKALANLAEKKYKKVIL